MERRCSILELPLPKTNRDTKRQKEKLSKGWKKKIQVPTNVQRQEISLLADLFISSCEK